MSKEYQINLAESVLLNIASELASIINEQTKKMISYGNEMYASFLRPINQTNTRQQVLNIAKTNKYKPIVHKPNIMPSDIEVAQVVELKAKEQGFLSQGIKLLPESTGGETLEFTIESPEKQEIVQERRLK